jgi:hypothetical protein
MKLAAPLALCIVLGIAALDAAANCADPNFHWSATNPPINVRHVFCGEFNAQGRPTGMHATVIANTSAIIVGINNPVNLRNGIYDATVTFSNNGIVSNKMSTFFPNACNQAQITNSIEYAATHQTGPAQPWGVLGPSAPQANDNTYCLGSNGQPFAIRMGLINNNAQVNTAFPQ